MIEALMLIYLITHWSGYLLIAMLAIVAVRRWPWLANESAAILELDQYNGLTAYVAHMALPAWGRVRVMSQPALPAGAVTGDPAADLQSETNSEIAETPQRIAETLAESFTFGETEALARLVASGKLGLTDAVKIGAGAKSGEKYQRRSREIKEAVDEMKNRFPQRTPDQQHRRDELGLPKR